MKFWQIKDGQSFKIVQVEGTNPKTVELVLVKVGKALAVSFDQEGHERQWIVEPSVAVIGVK